MEDKTPDHYQGIQPIDLIDQCVPKGTSPKASFFYVNLLKYVMRMFLKGQAISDVEKVIHYCELLKDELIEEQKPQTPF